MLDEFAPHANKIIEQICFVIHLNRNHDPFEQSF